MRVNNNGIWDPNIYVCIIVGWTSVFCLLCDFVSLNSIWFILSLPHVCSQNCIRQYSPHADMHLILDSKIMWLPLLVVVLLQKAYINIYSCAYDHLCDCCEFVFIIAVQCIFGIKDNQISRCSCLNLIPIRLYRWLYAVIFQFTNSDWFSFASICISSVYYLKWFSSEWHKSIYIYTSIA